MNAKNAISVQSRELSDDELCQVGGGFNPQPDPPGVVARPGVNNMLIGLLLPPDPYVVGRH